MMRVDKYCYKHKMISPQDKIFRTLTRLVLIYYHFSPLLSKEALMALENDCTKFIGDWQCGGKVITEKIREVNRNNLSVEFDFSNSDFYIPKAEPEKYPFLCKNGCLVADINSQAALEILASLPDLEIIKFKKNPGSYFFDKSKNMKYQSYEIIGKRISISSCTKVK